MNDTTFTLPHVKNKWAASLLQGLYTQHPYLIVDSANVVINDFALNDINIAIVYLTMQGQRFGVPTIIKENKAYPFDVIFLPNGDVEVLNKSNYERILAELLNIAAPVPEQMNKNDLFIPKTHGRLPIDQIVSLHRMEKLSSYNNYDKLMFKQYDPENFFKLSSEVFKVVPEEIKRYGNSLSLKRRQHDDTIEKTASYFELFDKTNGYEVVIHYNDDSTKTIKYDQKALQKLANAFELSQEELNLFEKIKYARFNKEASDYFINYPTQESNDIIIKKMNGSIEKVAQTDFLIKPVDPQRGKRITFVEKDENGNVTFTEPIYITKVAEDMVEGYSSAGFVKIKQSDNFFVKQAAVPSRHLYLLSKNALPFEAVDRQQYDFDAKYTKILKTASYNKLEIYKNQYGYIFDNDKMVKNIDELDGLLMKQAKFSASDVIYINEHLKNMPDNTEITIEYKHREPQQPKTSSSIPFEITKEEKTNFIKAAAYLLKIAQTSNAKPPEDNVKKVQPEITSRDVINWALIQDPDFAIANNLLEMTSAHNIFVEELLSQYELLEYTKEQLIKMLFQSESSLLPIEYNVIRKALLSLQEVIIRLEHVINQIELQKA